MFTSIPGTVLGTCRCSISFWSFTHNIPSMYFMLDVYKDLQERELRVSRGLEMAEGT